MAVFKLNICKFNNCDLIFNNLENLIRHIETNHINYDPKIIEQFETQQPTCLPLSYVLKFFADLPVEDKSNSVNSKLKQTLLSAKSIQSTNTSNESATNQQEVQNDATSTDSDEKSESWVSVKSNARVFKNLKAKKAFKCHCGKAYGTSPSLRKHATQCHKATIITAQVKEILQPNGVELSNINNLIQPYPSIALKQISSAGTPLKTLVVSTKPSNTETAIQSSTVQQPQRLMIQLSELNTITA